MRALIPASWQRDRAIVLAGLAGIAVISWAYLLHVAGTMPDMGMDMGMSQPHLEAWGTTDFVLNFVMWWVMMTGMMVPSASPMILTYTTLVRRRQAEPSMLRPVSFFVLGYLLVWGLFGAVATVAQWALVSTALLSPRLASVSPLLGGALLIAAGVFQWSSLKHACLHRCRTPLGFLLNEWRDGARGALSMGVRHGYFCVGCCALLMALLFVAGVMNLLWVAVIAVFVLLEKVAPAYEWVTRGAGFVMMLWGAALMASAVI